MAESIFFRTPNPAIIDELRRRYKGETPIRYPSLKAGERGIRRASFCEIYAVRDNTRRFIVACGQSSRLEKIEKRKIPGKSKAVTLYKLDKCEITQGGSYGSLNSISFEVSILIVPPVDPTTEFDEIFNRLESDFAVGREIAVRYGYEERTGDIFRSKEQIYRIHKPEFTVGTGTQTHIKFKVEGLGSAASTAVEQDINRINLLPLLGKSLRGQKQQVWKGNRATGFRFTTDYDATGDKRFSQVEGLVDFINFDVQSHAHIQRGRSDQFELANGSAVIGRHPIPPIAKILDPNAKYESTGFIVFQVDDAFYSSDFAIEDDTMGVQHVYYVTLQYIVWLLNWTMQSSTMSLRAQDPWRRHAKKYGNPYVNKFYIKCDAETTSGDLLYEDKNAETLYIPSTDPFSVLFSYGSTTTDKGNSGEWLATANYGYVTHHPPRTHHTGNGYSYSPAYDERTDVILFSGSPSQNQVSEMGIVYNGAKGRGGTQEAFSMRNGDLSKILINKDLLASILDELGGLKTTKTTVDQDVSKSSVGRFFEKLFQVIKNCSGGAIDLALIPDPDNKSTFTDILLIKNFNEKTDAAKRYVPTFNKLDGSHSQFSLKSKIPKSSQAAAFGGSKGPVEQSGAGPVVNQINDPDQQPVDQSPEVTRTNIEDAKAAMNRAKYTSDSCQAFAGIIKDLANTQVPEKQVEKRLSMFPLELTLKFLGINGFKFGDTVTTGQLPPKYRTVKGASKIGFTVNKVKHTFTGKKWETELSTTCRVIPKKLLQEQLIVQATP